MGLYRKGRFWGIDYYDGFKRRRKLIGPSKGEARKLLALARLARLRGHAQIPAVPRIEAPPFDQFLERYTEYSKTNKRGFYNERYRLRQLAKYFGKRKLSELTRWDAETFKIEMSRRVAPATVNRLLGNLKHILSMAVEWGALSNNPFVGVKLLRVPKRSERILTKDEEGKLLDACDQIHTPRLRSSVLMALNTGMRRGEIYGLRWEHVDCPNRSIKVIDGKTEQCERRIPMNDTLFESLSNLQSTQKSEFVFPSTHKIGDRLRDPKKGFVKVVRLLRYRICGSTICGIRLRRDSYGSGSI
jgi:integrase